MLTDLVKNQDEGCEVECHDFRRNSPSITSSAYSAYSALKNHRQSNVEPSPGMAMRGELRQVVTGWHVGNILHRSSAWRVEDQLEKPPVLGGKPCLAEFCDLGLNSARFLPKLRAFHWVKCRGVGMRAVLNAAVRTEVGSNAVKQVRKAGRIPAVLYGHGEQNVNLSLAGDEVHALIRHGSKLVDLKGDVSRHRFDSRRSMEYVRHGRVARGFGASQCRRAGACHGPRGGEGHRRWSSGRRGGGIGGSRRRGRVLGGLDSRQDRSSCPRVAGRRFAQGGRHRIAGRASHSGRPGHDYRPLRGSSGGRGRGRRRRKRRSRR